MCEEGEGKRKRGDKRELSNFCKVERGEEVNMVRVFAILYSLYFAIRAVRSSIPLN